MLIRHGTCSQAARGLFLPILLPVALLVTLPAIGAPVINSQTVSETALENGLRVIIKPERRWGVVSAGLVIKACPLYEAADRQGLADLVRHMIHDVPAPGDDLSLSDWITDRGGAIRSYTTPDGTHVRVTTSANFFPEALARTARATFEPSFREEIWANQLQTLRRRLMDAESSPVGKLWRTMWETAFRQHPYGRPVSGTPDGIAAYDAEDLAAYHREYFVPNNTALIVVGDVEADPTLDLVRELFGKYPRGTTALKEPDPEPIQTDTRTRLEKANTRNTLVSFGWHAAGIANKPDVCALDLIYALLIEGQQARLMQAFASQEEIGAVPEVEFIPPTRMQVHELKSDPLGTAWVNCTGTAFMRSLVGDPDGWLYIEFRVLVNWADPPGHYVSNALMYFQCAGFTGQIPLELHLNLTETLQVEIDADLEFPDTEGNFTGWMYTTNEGLLTVRSNVDFNLSVSACTDLTGPGAHLYEIETAFRLRQPADTGALWSTWGDIGGDESGHGTPDQWTGAPDGGSPWPGTVSNVSPVNTVGVNEIGLRGAAWRNGVEDLAGDYSGTLTITVSPIP